MNMNYIVAALRVQQFRYLASVAMLLLIGKLTILAIEIAVERNKESLDTAFILAINDYLQYYHTNLMTNIFFSIFLGCAVSIVVFIIFLLIYLWIKEVVTDYKKNLTELNNLDKKENLIK